MPYIPQVKVGNTIYDVKDTEARNRIDALRADLKSNAAYSTVKVTPGWSNSVYLFKNLTFENGETRLFNVEFEEAPSGSTYVTLEDGAGTTLYQNQLRNIRSSSFQYLADQKRTDVNLHITSENYDKHVSAEMIDPFKENSYENNIDRIKCLAEEKTGYISLARFSEFCHGGYYYPDKRYFKHMVMSLTPIHSENGIYIKIKSGYQVRAYTITDGTASDSGWQSVCVYIPAGKDFVISIQRATPDANEVVDVSEMVNALLVIDEGMFSWSDAKYYADFWQSGKNINWSTGAVSSASGYFELYTFKKPKFNRIRVHGSIYGRSNAEIAFYSTETPTEEGYVQYSSAQPGSWDEIHWTEAVVPDECKCVCVSSRNINNNNQPHEIEIYIDSAEKYMQQTQTERNAGLNIMSDNTFKYIYHMNADHLGESEIPSQSVFDIETAHRLGFKCYELNVHPTATAGKYVCMHGNSLKIGNELVAKNGDSISDIDINQIDYETFLNDYVYNTPIDKYKTHVTFLDDALALCKKYNMLPFLSWSNYEMIDYVKKICGNNFILNVYNDYYIRRALYRGTYSIYRTLDDQQLKTLIENIGAPFIYSLTVDHINMTDDQIKEQIGICHDNGCIVSFAGVYQTQAQNTRFFNLGADIMASGWDVEYFSNGNLLSLKSNGTFADFHHGGSVADGVLTLPDETYLSSNYTEAAPELSKGILTICFNGTIKVTMGPYINEVQVESDGTECMQFSTAFFKYSPNFTVQAVGETTIFDCIYDVSEC